MMKTVIEKCSQQVQPLYVCNRETSSSAIEACTVYIHVTPSEMKGTEVLTLGAVGVLNLYTEVHVHTTKLFWPATYTSSWASYFSRLAMVAPPVHILMSEWCGVIIRAGYAFMFTFHV